MGDLWTAVRDAARMAGWSASLVQVSGTGFCPRSPAVCPAVDAAGAVRCRGRACRAGPGFVVSVEPWTMEAEAFALVAALAVEGGRVASSATEDSLTDTLTNLPNRRALEIQMEAAATRGGYGLAIADIDHFKRVNDSLGHDAGDEVLRHVARVMSLVVRPKDLLARFGGEEFVVLVRDGEPRILGAVMERVRQAVERTGFCWNGRQVPLTVSLGGACLQLHGGTPEDVLKAADKCLYQAKEGGRNRCVVSG